jgi:subtilisin family serine protease
LAILLLVCVSFVAAAPLHRSENGELVEGQYIVILKADLSESQVNAHIEGLRSQVSLTSNSSILNSYKIGTFQGFSARLTDDLLANELASEDVDYIEVDQVARIAQDCRTQQTTEWGLDRVSERELNLDGKYIYPGQSGAGTDSYIVDTGIRITHNEFATGRAVWGANYVNDGIQTDCNGHGTHVAGTVGGVKYGVAKATKLIAVKVLGCSGSGTYEGVIAGVNYVATEFGKSKRPSVANLSLGGGKSTALEAAIRAGTTAGATYVLAAGNSNNDACTGSPSGVGGTAGPALTIGATTVEDQGGNSEDSRATFSSWGRCTDVFAPGQLITSAWNNADDAVRTISGTSMAAPHVAGICVLYLGQNPTAKPADLKTNIPGNATPGLINLKCGSSSACLASPNKLVYSPCV